MINISIADSQPVVMQGLRCFFNNHLAISITDTIYQLDDIEYSLQQNEVNILIVDIELEGLHSINSIKKIIKDHPKTKILIYTCASEKLFGALSLKTGVSGFISKNDSLQLLEYSLLKIAEGKIMFSEQVHQTILESTRINKEKRLFRKLSLRETEVLRHVMTGKKNFEISQLLKLNEKTISTYKLRLFNKLNVRNVVDLVNKAKTLEIF